MTEGKLTKHATFFGLFIAAIVFGIILLWPFVKVLVVSVALAVVFFPIYRWFLRRVTRGNTWFAAFCTVVLFLVLICGPLFLIGSSVFHQAQSAYQALSGASISDGLFERVDAAVARFFPGASFDFDQRIAETIGAFGARIGDIATYVFGTLLSIFLIVLTMFYFLKDGARWRTGIIQGSPLSNESTQRIVERLAHAIEGVVKGYLLIGVLQGLLLGIGLWVFGVPNPALWGVLAGIASFVPAIGTSLVSIPAVLYLLFQGETAAAIGLAAWAALLVGLIDNLLTPVVVGRKIEIHPMFILFSILGGIVLMGPAGIIMGPLVVSFIYALTSVYKSEIKE